MKKHILMNSNNLAEVTKAFKDFGYTQGSGYIYYPDQLKRISFDFDVGISGATETNTMSLSICIFNEGMLQDKRVKELLLEYLI